MGLKSKGAMLSKKQTGMQLAIVFIQPLGKLFYRYCIHKFHEGVNFIFFLPLITFSLKLPFFRFTHLICILSINKFISSVWSFSSYFPLKSSLHVRSGVSLRFPLLPYIIILHPFIYWLFFTRSILVYSYFFQSCKSHTIFSTELSQSITALVLNYTFLW